MASKKHAISPSLYARIRAKRKILIPLFCIFILAYPVTLLLNRNHTVVEYNVTPSQPPYLTVFLIDGLNQEIFQDELAKGNLPNIQKLINDGTYIKNGITCFPSMTGYCYYALQTGYESSRSGMSGSRWFSRPNTVGNFRNYFAGPVQLYLGKDINTSTPTLFEAVSEWSWSGNSMLRRGNTVEATTISLHHEAKMRNKWWWTRLYSHVPFLSRVLAPDFEDAEEEFLRITLEGLKYLPKVQWCVFSGADSCEHTNGFGTRYREVLRVIDNSIGAYRKESEMLGTEKYRTYALVSDHGGANVTHNLDVSAYLVKKGLKTYRGVAKDGEGINRPIEYYNNYHGVELINGDTMSHLYFKNPDYSKTEGWHHRNNVSTLQQYPVSSKKKLNIIQTLLEFNGVELVVAYDTPSRAVYVYSPNGGSATIHMNSRGEILYNVTSSSLDPLEYTDSSLKGTLAFKYASTRKYYSEQQWLDATHNTKFPYGVVRLYQVMSSPQGSDIILTAKLNYDFGKEYEKLYVKQTFSFDGGHGGLRGDQLRVPYVLAGYGVKKGEILDSARAEDIGATLMHLFGESPTPKPPTENQDAPYHHFPQTGEFQDPIKTADTPNSDLWQGKVLRSALHKRSVSDDDL